MVLFLFSLEGSQHSNLFSTVVIGIIARAPRTGPKLDYSTTKKDAGLEKGGHDKISSIFSCQELFDLVLTASSLWSSSSSNNRSTGCAVPPMITAPRKPSLVDHRYLCPATAESLSPTTEPPVDEEASPGTGVGIQYASATSLAAISPSWCSGRITYGGRGCRFEPGATKEELAENLLPSTYKVLSSGCSWRNAEGA